MGPHRAMGMGRRSSPWAASSGTLSEIALAPKMGKPVVGMDTWELSRQGRRAETIARVAGPGEAVAFALRLAARPGLDPASQRDKLRQRSGTCHESASERAPASRTARWS